jgi:hypothetical protein
MTELDRMQEAIMVECTIQCSKCGKTYGPFVDDEYNFSEHCLDLGWRATPNNIYCPECAKKYLKK